jgi:hypothetical protein
MLKAAALLMAALALVACDGHAVMGKACKKGKVCGKSCISHERTCRVD